MLQSSFNSEIENWSYVLVLVICITINTFAQPNSNFNMNSFFGTLKVWLAIFLFLSAVVASVVPLLNNQFALTYLLGSIVITFYGYCMLYSGRTQRKNLTVDKPIIIWLEILYGVFCLCYYIYD